MLKISTLSLNAPPQKKWKFSASYICISQRNLLNIKIFRHFLDNPKFRECSNFFLSSRNNATAYFGLSSTYGTFLTEFWPPQISPFRWKLIDALLIVQCYFGPHDAKWRITPSNDFSRVRVYDRRIAYRQTERPRYVNICCNSRSH